MKISGFRKAGHSPTLLAAFLYFDVSFMAWVLLGPLAPFISESLKLSPAQKGLMVALPLLAGSFFRPLMGILGDRIGGRKAGVVGLALTLVPLLLGWKFATTLPHFYAVGFLLGIAGASFAVALPMAGAWYPPEYQGLAMGIAGAGNSGTLMATFFAPRLAQHFGWHATFALAILPITAVLLAYAWIAKDSPKRPKAVALRDYASLFKESDTAWFCLIYSLTFGGFVGFASFLTLFFYDQYHLTKVQAGDFTTLVVIAGSMLRPVGGWLADRIGGYRLLLILLTGVGCCLAAVSMLPPLALVSALLFVSMGMLGMGNGAVFQMVPQRFPKSVGILTGLVGAAGGLGGFALPSVLGLFKERLGQYGPGILMFAAVYAAGAFVLLQLGTVWRGTWENTAVDRVGIFCYRTILRGSSVGKDDPLQAPGMD